MSFDFSILKSIACGEPVKKIYIKVFGEGEPQATQEQPALVGEQELPAEAEYEDAGLDAYSRR